MPIIIPIASVAMLAVLIAAQPLIANLGLSALSLSIVIGMLVAHLPAIRWNQQVFPVVALEKKANKKILDFCKQKLLRLGIVLFGFYLNLNHIVALGWQVVLLDVIVIISVFVFGYMIGTRWLKIPKDLVILVSIGSAVCGAAAVLAAETVTKAKQQCVVIAIATVVLFGTIAMFSYSLIVPNTYLSEYQAGIYIGSTVHEVAQAIAAGENISVEAMKNAVVVKLIRVVLLAPLIIVIGIWLSKSSFVLGSSDISRKKLDETSRPKIAFPWFVLGFLFIAVLNTFIAFPAWLLDSLKLLSQVCLSIAMVALGLQTNFSALKKAGFKPILLAGILFLLLIFGGLWLNSILIVN